MTTPPLTPEQEKHVADLVARGLTREAAIVLVLETTEDVIDDHNAHPPSEL